MWRMLTSGNQILETSEYAKKNMQCCALIETHKFKKQLSVFEVSFPNGLVA